MSTSPPTVVELAARLEALERQNRRLRRAAGLLVLLAAGYWLLTREPEPRAQAQGASSRVVEASQFVVRDANGKRRIMVGMVDNAPFLAVADADEKPRAAVTIGRNGPAFALLDATRKQLASLEWDDKAGAGSLVLRDASGQQRVGLTVEKKGQGLELRDAEGKQRVTLHADPPGNAALQFFDKSNRPRAGLGFDAKNGPGLDLKSDTGKSLFSRP